MNYYGYSIATTLLQRQLISLHVFVFTPGLHALESGVLLMTDI